MDFRAKKKIFVIPPPATGHVNPICCLVGELCKNPNLEVFFYSDETYRELVEKTGATFRAFSHQTMGRLLKKARPINQGKMGIDELLHEMINFSYDLLPQLISDVENDEPDMIIYDAFFLPVKFMLEVIQSRIESGKWTHREPKTVGFAPNFPFSEKMAEALREGEQMTFWSTVSILNLFKRLAIFSWWYGISVYNPFKFFIKNDPNLNIVGVAAELQPFTEDLDDTFKFVGPCVSEETRKVEIKNDPELNALFDLFPVKTDKLNTTNSDLKFIFISLGTVFTSNIFIFERAIEAIRNYDKKTGRKFKSSQLRVVISVGDGGVKHFNEKKSIEGFVLPENILIRARVPQLEVLKRADLFVTHCGMNSTLETITYSVPIIAVPLAADQPVIAKHICDNLSFGIRLDSINFTGDQMVDAIDQVLSDSKYRNNVSSMSKKLSKYNGTVEGAKIVIEHLNQQDKKK